MKPLLDIQNLSINFATDEGLVHAVNDVSLQVQAGEAIAIVGESGAGKSQIFQSVMGLLTPNATATGRVDFKSNRILNKPSSVLNQLRGKHISMIFQDPMTSLNPYLRVGKQLIEVLQTHQKISTKEAQDKSMAMLHAVKLRNPEHCFKQYPHELSGGMRQRICIAMALLCEPDLLIADEPTTALDVTVQAGIMDLLKELHASKQMAIVFITHDLPLALNFCKRIVVMYAGRIVETGSTQDILYASQHPYTRALLAASPQHSLNELGRFHAIDGMPPDPLIPLTHCAFKNRCNYANKQCEQQPDLLAKDDGHQLACFNPITKVL